MDKKLPGYSLLEVVIVIAIFVVVVAVLLPFSLSMIRDNRVAAVTAEMSSHVFTRQQSAYNFDSAGQEYGIAFSSSEYILFVGPSLAAATETETHAIPYPITISNIDLADSGSEIVFAQGSLTPSTNGEITVADNNYSYKLKINAEGLIDYYQL